MRNGISTLVPGSPAFSPDSISSLVRQYVQAFERDPRESNRIFASKLKRRRGGQPGNENRRIHGYYSRDAKYLHDGIRAFEWLMRVLAADLEGHS
ncbi:MAG: hypothetical protein WDM86_22905 [Rhizomicrobium sp.]